MAGFSAKETILRRSSVWTMPKLLASASGTGMQVTVARASRSLWNCTICFTSIL